MKPGPAHVRKTVLWIIPPLIVIICGAILGAFAYQIGKMRDSVLERLVEDTAEQVETRLEAFFEPIASKLLVARNWGRTVHPDLGDAPALNTQFIPLLQQLPHVSAVLLGDAAGRAYVLMRDGDGWLTRLTDAERAGPARWTRWETPTQPVERWSEASDYDPRTRPWFVGARDAPGDDTPFWTEPYLFFSGDEKGITAAVRWGGRDRPEHITVVAFDVLLDQIAAFTASLAVREHGDVFIVTDEGRVIGPPQDKLFSDRATVRDAVLAPIDTLGVGHLAAAFSAWNARPDGANQPFRYLGNGVHWWAAFRPLAVGNRTFWLGITVPEYELVDSLGAYRNVVPAAIIALGLAAFIASILLVRKHGQQMDALARAARRLRSADDDPLETGAGDPAHVRALLARGESERLEFKSTIRWNLRADKPDKEMELAWLKSVVGFLNTDGGIILIGVDDDGNVLGLEPDGFASADKCLRHIGNLIHQHIGVEFAQFIRYSLVTIDAKSIAVIQCARATTPAFLKTGKDEDFYVRAGPASQKLSTSQILGYIESRRTP
jgi:hypothetical protein